MQLFVVFCVLFLLRFTESSSVESDMLSSVDIIAFNRSLNASQHYDHPRVGGRVAKAEEARIWQTVIPDARIEEIVAASRKGALRKAKQYKWVNENVDRNNPLTPGHALLGMRRPDFDGSTAPVKVLYSRSRQVNQDALSVMLPQLEQSKDKIMEWMARNQASIPSVTPKTAGPLAKRSLLVPQATNYHPRVFKHPYFTTGDLVAWMALAAASRQKGHADAFKFFKAMAQSFLPGFIVSLEAVPTSSAGKPTKTVFLHRPFQYVPAGADLAFYFDGNRGKFLKTQEDSIVLNRPEGTVDGQQHAALVLSSNANVDACILEMHQNKISAVLHKISREALEEMAFALPIYPETTSDEVQAMGVSTIRSFAARLERDSFLEAQRRAPELKPKLLIDLLSAKLVNMVIDYFNDDTYSVTAYTHRWTIGSISEIAVDSARVYAITDSKGVKSLSHSLENINEDARYVEFGDPRWCMHHFFTGSHDGQYVLFSHSYKTPTHSEDQPDDGIKWFMQGKSTDEKPRRVIFDGEHLYSGTLSRDGRTLLALDAVEPPVAHVYRISETNPAVGVEKFKLSGEPVAVSGKGNRVMLINNEQIEVYDLGRDTHKPIYRTSAANINLFALNEEGNEAAFATADKKLRFVKVGAHTGSSTPRAMIVAAPKLLGSIIQLVYDNKNKLHALHYEGNVSLFDPLTKKLVLVGDLQRSLKICSLAISPNADYIAILMGLGEAKKGKFEKHQVVVRRKLGKADWERSFGYKARKAAVKQQP